MSGVWEKSTAAVFISGAIRGRHQLVVNDDRAVCVSEEVGGSRWCRLELPACMHQCLYCLGDNFLTF